MGRCSLTAGKRMAMSRDEDAVHQAIQMILGTAPGERVMRPEFGCGIHDLVFAPNTPGTAGQVDARRARRSASSNGNPALTCSGSTHEPDETAPHLLRIVITYQVRTDEQPLQPGVSVLPGVVTYADASAT